MSEWKGIASCPNDGSNFIALDKLGFVVIAYKDKCNGQITVAWDGQEFTDCIKWCEIPN